MRLIHQPASMPQHSGWYEHKLNIVECHRDGYPWFVIIYKSKN